MEETVHKRRKIIRICNDIAPLELYACLAVSMIIFR